MCWAVFLVLEIKTEIKTESLTSGNLLYGGDRANKLNISAILNNKNNKIEMRRIAGNGGEAPCVFVLKKKKP